ncbi:Ataxin-3-like [Vitis vinifera]|uniref:ubiquitinyl hydrolase 1 n=1 Tax=Vitis vinifera TaxID=29760 RepID=A0A438JAZ4_VITVI|nr:Ataxin-3-like [Vitis vinifera]RVX06134.1 Ataxin-3-like [Vitis vinifera]
MEGPSNGGMLYHEVQESKLCAVHCVNTVLQGPFFTEIDLAALASDLDLEERRMMLQPSAPSAEFLSEDSHNVSMDGDFSIQVQVWRFDRFEFEFSVNCCHSGVTSVTTQASEYLESESVILEQQWGNNMVVHVGLPIASI